MNSLLQTTTLAASIQGKEASDCIQVNVFEVVSHRGINDRITSSHLTSRTMLQLSSIEMHIELSKNKVEDPP
jgi:hypothetical protein